MLRLCLMLALAPAAEWPITRGPSREPDPYRFDPKAVKDIPKALLDDSVAVVLYAGATYRVEADGTVETTTHEVTRLGGRKAVERLGEFRNITYSPGYQKLTLHVARIHKPTGKVVEVEPRHVHLRDVGTDYQVYDPDKQLIVSFPGLEVGDVLEAKWTVRGKNPEHGGRFFQRYSFGDPTYPALLDDLRVLVPKDVPLKFALRKGVLDPKVVATKGEKDGLVYHRWRATDCPPPPQDESLPSKEELRPGVLLSTFASWDEVGRWKAKLRESCWECGDKVKKAVAEVTKGLKTQAEKARALTYFVRRNVRYLSAGERHDYTPHPPAEVLDNRAGDCKDSSQLLAVMLREAGLKVELVTLGALDDGQVDPDVPSPWGTHAILAVTIDGKLHWIDTTARLCGWDQLPRDDLGRLCYLTDDKGKLRLVKSPPPTAETRKTHATTEVWIDEDGDARHRRVSLSHGLAALQQRERYVEVPAGERRRQMTAALQDSNSRARLTELKVDEAALADHDRPVKVEVAFEIPKLFSGSSEREGSFADNATWSRLLAYSIDHERTTAMVLPGAFHSVHVYRVHLPAGWVLDGLPKGKKHESKWGRFSLAVKALDAAEQDIELTFETRLEEPRVELADLDAYRQWYDDVQRDYRAWLTLKPASSAASAERLETFLKGAPANTAAAKALARIYVKAKKYAEARRVIEAAAKHAPDDADLLELRLDAAETDEQEEEARRAQLKRDPKDRRVQLGLAAVLVNRSKHDEARKMLATILTEGTSTEKAKAHYQMARSRYRKDELKPALEQLDLAAKADAEAVNTVRAWRLRGQILEELKRPADALAAFTRAFALDRTNEEVQLILVRLAIETKDELTALDHLRRYTLRNSKSVPGLVLAAETYLKLNRPDEAMEAALRAREIDFHERAQRIIGLVTLRRGEYARALNHLDRAEPDATVVAGMIRAAALAGKPEALPGVLEKAAKLDAPPKALVAQAQALLARRKAAGDAVACAEFAYRTGQPADAVRALLRPGEKTGPGLALRARLALDAGRLREALADADAALKASPGEPTALLVRGRVGFERGTRGHLDDLQGAVVATGRKDADSLQALAEALGAAGQKADALKAAKEALALRPRDAALAELLGRLEAPE